MVAYLVSVRGEDRLFMGKAGEEEMLSVTPLAPRRHSGN